MGTPAAASVCIEVCLHPTLAARLAQHATIRHRSIQAEARAAITAHLTPHHEVMHPTPMGDGHWHEDTTHPDHDW